jgi:DeoR family transcriptional regulator, glycerol-3-phosphate regulon repressor
MDLSDRQQEILARIRSGGALYIEDLAQSYGLTTQTLRRDINALCDLGLARRFHGGVDLPVEGRNISVSARAALNAGPKRAIARRIAADIADGATVLMGIGTTVQFVAEALHDHRDLTIVTNNLDVALVLSDSKQHEVHMTGGVMRHDDRDVVGEDTIRFLAKFHATVAVIGAGGLSAANGLMDFSYAEALVSNALIDNARTTLLAVDSSKWNRGETGRVAPLSRVSAIYTDCLPDDGAARDALRDSRATIITCED